MPEKEPQKVDESQSFGGNSSHGRPAQRAQETKRVETKPRPRGVPKSTASKIPVTKNRRVPFKHVQASSSSSDTTKDISSEQLEQVRSKGAENMVTMTTTVTTTRVKKVPDFRKLHSKWSKKIERAKKENKSSIHVQEFPITPRGKFTPNKPCPKPVVSRRGENPSIISTTSAASTQLTTASSEQQLSPFKADSASLHNILHGNGEPPSLSHRATLACGELRIPRDTMSYRYSMYRRRPAVAPSAAVKGSANSPGLFASVSHAQGRELLTRLATTTLNSLRTVSKINHRDDTSDNAEFSSIKKSLTFTAEDEQIPNISHNNTILPDSSQPNGYSIDSRRDFVEYSRRKHAPELVPKDEFYVLEPELCNLLKGGGVARHCIGGRGQCPSPVAQLLDNVYFVPINNY